MTLLFADLTGIPIVRAMLVIPFAGIWHADVTLDRALGPAPVGPQVLTLAGTTWACSPVRAIDFSGTRQVRLVGGTGGWRSAVLFQEYASPAGVPTQTVLTDVATQAKELTPVTGPTIPATLGQFFCRQADRASLVLNQIAGWQWWMDPTGIVQMITRPPTPVATPFTATAVDGCMGRYTISTEYPANWMPGAIFTGPTVGPATVSRVVHILEAGSLRTEVLAA